MRRPRNRNPVPDAVALDQAQHRSILRPVPQIVEGGTTAGHAQIVRPERNFDGARVSPINWRGGEVRHRWWPRPAA